MTPNPEKSQLKRSHVSGEDAIDTKKPRRSDRIQSQAQTKASPNPGPLQLLTPLDLAASTATEARNEPSVTPAIEALKGLSSPPTETQALSQVIKPPSDFSHEVKDEEAEGVWGYLVPEDDTFGATLVLKKRAACVGESSVAAAGQGKRRKGPVKNAGSRYLKEEEAFERGRVKKPSTGGYLIGRHPECDRIIDLPSVSNRHCLIFPENAHGGAVALLEDLSTNGTWVNDAVVGRNGRRELHDSDEISIANVARFVFRYPRSVRGRGFRHQYTTLQQLGKGHFATVYLCVEKATGQTYAVKVFNRRPGTDERSKFDGLQQEVAVLMSVSHPNMLCLKECYDEAEAVYLVLELAPEGELFNLIVMRTKLTEDETRKVFIQLFQGVKYLHERDIVHRDIKPENILLVDKDLTVKLADFGLAKIIGEQSFTTTLCGTPSYVAPEILEHANNRMYTRAVDIWSLGVVLYICLCGFPPFSDELYGPDNPFTLSQQIKLGRFDYPSPYWDSIADPALDLIDRMLTVNVDKRITVEECLEHPWITQASFGPNDSTDGLTGAMRQLDFSKRKVQRERTLLSSVNDVKINKIIETAPGEVPVKIFAKKPSESAAMAAPSQTPLSQVSQAKAAPKNREETPASQRDPREFMQLGGKGDLPLIDNGGSSYAPDAVLKAAASPA